jgi:2-dehydro-3-deoxygluconokinase
MRVVCHGELLLRLAAPAPELLLQSARLDVLVGGAEANVAVSLSCFGHEAAVASTVPDNALGAAARGELRRRGVCTRAVGVGPGRMGLYFLTPAAGLRPAEVLYDRAGSAFTRQPLDEQRLEQALLGAQWLHVSGISAALGRNAADAVLRACQMARTAGVRVSFDCNYRPSLWQEWQGDAPGILRQLAAEADLVFADDRALALVLGAEATGDTVAARFSSLAATAFAAFPHAQRIVTTTRVELSADHHQIGGLLLVRGAGAVIVAAEHSLSNIVDRIGSGDAFAAGILHGLDAGMDEPTMLAFGVAAAALKHSVPGDANLVSAREVAAYLGGAGFGVRR